jgi:isocitrate/isopropylmalate dehydrogenase
VFSGGRAPAKVALPHPRYEAFACSRRRAEPGRGFVYETVAFPWGSEHYLATGSMMDPDALERLAAFDAIYFGAVGTCSVPDHVTLWGLRLEIVQGFDHALRLRPPRLLPGIPLAGQTKSISSS